MITFRDFIIFLAENHCLGAYWTNLEKVYKIEGIRLFNDHIDCILRLPPLFWLANSFVWSNSNEGDAFWHDINKYWIDRYREIIGSKN